MTAVKPSHECPAPECKTRVDNSRLACVPHWYALPMVIRQGIWRTAKLPITHQARREALSAALAQWRIDLVKAQQKEVRKRPKTS